MRLQLSWSEQRTHNPLVLGSSPSGRTKYKEKKMKQYMCEVCGHIHDEETMGKLEDLPKYANCPECGVDAREAYKEVE